MLDVLLLRFDAPMMSFGGPLVDNHGVVQSFPALSMVCGLLGNALGYDHLDAARLSSLQDRLRYAARQDRRGASLRDYQTVDLGQDFMLDDRAWTTRGRTDRRAGASGQGTHVRFRDYRVDAVFTVALSLEPADLAPDLGELQAALLEPERPLFIGRKCCLPASPILAGRVRAESLLAALQRAPFVSRADPGSRFPVWAAAEEWEAAGMETPSRLSVTDTRDWRNQIHVGERIVMYGMLPVEGRADE